MTIERPLGWLPDPAHATYRSGHSMLARARRARALPPLEHCSLLEFEPELLFQGYVGSCVSVGTKGMFLDWCSANDEERFEVSERALYWQSRVLEYVDAGDDPDEVRKLVAEAGDTGAYPWLAFRAWDELGLVPYSACPGKEPTSDDDVHEFVAVQPAPEVFAAGYANQGLDFARVAGSGLEKVRQVASMLQNRIPVGFGMTVDLEFMRNDGRVIQDHNEYMTQGGHWMRIVAVLNGVIERPTVRDADSVLEWLRQHEISDPAEVGHQSVIVVSQTWRDWGLPNGMGLIGAGHWAEMASDVTGVRWLPREAAA